jgi:glycosyltransferase XagB
MQTTDLTAPGLSVIIPTLNESANIPALIERLTKALAHLDAYEVIFIDDHSSDGTFATIHEYTALYPIRVYYKTGQIGKAQSLIEGFRHARYDTIAMIDGDLQYPPEAIPEMYRELSNGYGIIVANRKESYTSPLRKIMSRVFSFFFSRLLHNLHCDVQSGLKLFKQEILNRIEINPSPWAFDLEFLVKARSAGYPIKSHDIIFAPREGGKSKINILSSSLEIALSAIRLKLTQPNLIPMFSESGKANGFSDRRQFFQTYSPQNPAETAYYQLDTRQKITGLIIAGLILLGFLLNWHLMLTLLIAGVTILYFLDLFFNFVLIYRTYTKPPEINIRDEELEQIPTEDWPMYTILCPLYREWQVLPQFIRAIENLDYPSDKLQVMLLLESDDTASINYVRSIVLPNNFEIHVIPDALPKTKPKALNYGLERTRGQLLVIYDAEDQPERLQLKKTVRAFAQSAPETVCIQAKLNFYNPTQNLLTRLFTAEYSLWFDLILTGLQSVQAPIPLGGTSNHFKVNILRELHGWDPFNVTEDCDLGIRLAKRGYKTAIVNSVTLEEATSQLGNWLRQRSRWIKGYIQTYLVHLRRSQQSFKTWSRINQLIFHLIIGGKGLSIFINPIMWLITLSYFLFRPQLGLLIESFYPLPILYMGVVSFILGNFLYMYYYMMACAKREQYDLIKYAFFVPFYWIAMSIAAWKALYQFIRKPHFWEKTRHGLYLDPSSSSPLAQESPNLSAAAHESRMEKPNFNLTNGGILFSALVVGSLLNFIYNAFAGRVLEFTDYGLITLLNTFWYLLSIVLTSLLTTLNRRVSYLNVKDGPSTAHEFFIASLKKILPIGLIISMGWLIISPFLTSYFQENSILTFLSFGPVIFFALYLNLAKGYLQGAVYLRLLAAITIIEPAAKLLLLGLILLMNQPKFAYLSIPLSVLVSSALIFAFTPRIKRPAEVSSATELAFPRKFFLASMLLGLSSTAFLSIDVLMAKHYFPPSLAGEYALLSLVGKMIYFFSSLFNTFIVTAVGRLSGKKKTSQTAFYKLFAGTFLMATTSFIALGLFGSITVPILLGTKAMVIVPYLVNYCLSITLFTIANTIVVYHLAREEFIFSKISVALAICLGVGIIFNHQSIQALTDVVLVTSLSSFGVITLMHFLYGNTWIIANGINDLRELFFPSHQFSTRNSDKLNILVLNWRDTRHKYSGGAEVYVHELAKRWISEGHRVTQFCGNDGKCTQYETIDGVEIIRRGGFYLVYVWAFLYYVTKFRGQYDVIIDCENGIPFFSPLYSRKPHYLVIHHVHQDLFKSNLKYHPVARLAQFLELRLMPLIYKKTPIITVSPSTKDDIQNILFKDIEPQIVYNGVDTVRYQPGIKSPHPTVLYLGRLKDQKCVDVLIKAAKIIIKKIPNVEIIIAGDGDSKNKLINLTRKLGLESQVKFLGRVSEELKVKLYQQAWIFVNPSLIEGWGITTIEANACGTPIVAANVAGLRNSVKNPHTGYLVKHGDIAGFANRIEELLLNDQLRHEMSTAAVDWAKHFDWEQSSSRFLQIINQPSNEQS